jgi:LPXTG-motif cell wall-anchored protein
MPGGTVSTLKLAAAMLVAAVVAFVPASTAQAAYEDPVIEIEVDPNPLVGGDTFTATITSGGVDCEWTATFLGETKTGSGDEFVVTFDTPEVDEETDETLFIECAYDDGNPEQNNAQAGVASATNASFSRTSQHALPTVIQVVPREVTITLLPSADDDDDDSDDDDDDGDGGGKDDNGSLPDTGGPNLAILAAGMTLLVAGAGGIVAVRRRNGGTT